MTEEGVIGLDDLFGSEESGAESEHEVGEKQRVSQVVRIGFSRLAPGKVEAVGPIQGAAFSVGRRAWSRSTHGPQEAAELGALEDSGTPRSVSEAAFRKRWPHRVVRYRVGETGALESNARLVRWSDGRVQLFVGSEPVYDLLSRSLRQKASGRVLEVGLQDGDAASVVSVGSLQDVFDMRPVDRAMLSAESAKEVGQNSPKRARMVPAISPSMLLNRAEERRRQRQEAASLSRRRSMVSNRSALVPDHYYEDGVEDETMPSARVPRDPSRLLQAQRASHRNEYDEDDEDDDEFEEEENDEEGEGDEDDGEEDEEEELEEGDGELDDFLDDEEEEEEGKATPTAGGKGSASKSRKVEEEESEGFLSDDSSS